MKLDLATAILNELPPRPKREVCFFETLLGNLLPFLEKHYNVKLTEKETKRSSHVLKAYFEANFIPMLAETARCDVDAIEKALLAQHVHSDVAAYVCDKFRPLMLNYHLVYKAGVGSPTLADEFYIIDSITGGLKYDIAITDIDSVLFDCFNNIDDCGGLGLMAYYSENIQSRDVLNLLTSAHSHHVAKALTFLSILIRKDLLGLCVPTILVYLLDTDHGTSFNQLLEDGADKAVLGDLMQVMATDVSAAYPDVSVEANVSKEALAESNSPIPSVDLEKVHVTPVGTIDATLENAGHFHYAGLNDLLKEWDILSVCMDTQGIPDCEEPELPIKYNVTYDNRLLAIVPLLLYGKGDVYIKVTSKDESRLAIHKLLIQSKFLEADEPPLYSAGNVSRLATFVSLPAIIETLGEDAELLYYCIKEPEYNEDGVVTGTNGSTWHVVSCLSEDSGLCYATHVSDSDNATQHTERLFKRVDTQAPVARTEEVAVVKKSQMPVATYQQGGKFDMGDDDVKIQRRGYDANHNLISLSTAKAKIERGKHEDTIVLDSDFVKDF